MIAPKKSPIRVMLIEDEQTDAVFISRMLSRNPEALFEVDHVQTLSKALDRIPESDYDVALLDLKLPDAVGLESFEQIRVLDARIPIVVLTGIDDEALALSAIESGAQDFMSKEHLTGQMLFRALRFAIARQRKVLGYQADADSDPLTGMPNRRHLQSRFEQSLSAAEKSKVAMSMAFFDLDHFKKVNDTYGHFVGDSVLKHVAAVLTGSLRGNMSVARFGGEEFAWLMPGFGLTESGEMVVNTLERLASKPVEIGDLSIPVTASAGLINVPYTDTWEAAYIACDAALYEAKSSGRNRMIKRPRGD